jgi:hypothetical protein
VLWVLPPVASLPYTYPQLLPGYTAILSMGLLIALAFPFFDALDSVVQTQRLTIYITPKLIDLLVDFVAVFIVSVVLGLIIWRLLKLVKFRGVIRFLLYGNFVFGLGFGFLVLIQGPLSPPDVGPYTLQSTCEIPISETIRIREEYSDSTRPEHRGLSGIPLFRGTSYFISRTSDETWSQFMHLSHWYGDCENSGIVSGEFFWFWEWGALFVTHDAGESWHIWTVHDLGEDFAVFGGRLADSRIESVTFADETSGQMKLSNSHFGTPDDPRFTLVTTDGGLTWH